MPREKRNKHAEGKEKQTCLVVPKTFIKPGRNRAHLWPILGKSKEEPARSDWDAPSFPLVSLWVSFRVPLLFPWVSRQESSRGSRARRSGLRRSRRPCQARSSARTGQDRSQVCRKREQTPTLVRMLASTLRYHPDMTGDKLQLLPFDRLTIGVFVPLALVGGWVGGGQCHSCEQTAYMNG